MAWALPAAAPDFTGPPPSRLTPPARGNSPPPFPLFPGHCLVIYKAYLSLKAPAHISSSQSSQLEGPLVHKLENQGPERGNDLAKVPQQLGGWDGGQHPPPRMLPPVSLGPLLSHPGDFLWPSSSSLAAALLAPRTPAQSFSRALRDAPGQPPPPTPEQPGWS